jgi:hypothetical protein
LAHGQAQVFGGLGLRDPFDFQLLHNFGAAQFMRAHGQ